MAAVLELLFKNEISPFEIVHFITGRNVKANKESQLKELQLRSDFLPFFLNYLRDSTSHLICSVNSSTNTPAKTPTSAQKLRQAVKNSQRRRGNRTKLFSPNVSSQTEHSFQHSTPNSESNFSPSNLSYNTPSSTKSNQSLSSRDRSRREERSWRKDTSSSPGITPMKSESVTLGQYLNTPDSGRHIKKKSPSFVEVEHLESSSYRTPSPIGSRNKRSGGKNRSGGSGRRAKIIPQNADTPTCFKLDTQDFPSIGAAKSIKPRRITPTLVSKDTRKDNNVLFTIPSDKDNISRVGGTDGKEPFQNTFRSPMKSLKEERELLRQEKLKRLDSIPQEEGILSPGRMVPTTPTKPPFRNLSITTIDELVAKRSMVTHSGKLDVLAELYSKFIQECLIPNLPVEVYFLVQLLTSHASQPDDVAVVLHGSQPDDVAVVSHASQPDDVAVVSHGSQPDDVAVVLESGDLEDINYLSTIHNCVYFAVKVLEGQSRILSLLDETTVKLISENAHILEFSPDFKNHFLSESTPCSSSTALPVFTSPVNAVHFSADTDNRQNFPSNQSFHGFKKQRDQFYELLREWEDNHRLPGWNMKEMQATKIRSVIKQATDPTNYIHFARLFRSQLITMCQGDSSFLTGSDTEDQHLLSQLKKSNPEKFKRLQERFFTPSRSVGPCPPPSFNGCQEFFRDFIVCAESYIFNQHLMDSFSAKIIELNDTSIILTDNQDQLLKEEQRENFKLSLKTLRLLSKFLGFMVFLPYRGNNTLIDNVGDEVITLRNKCQPPLDLCGYVKASFVDRRLVFTIPWVVEFLSMMDSISPHLLYYQNLIITLVDIYRFSSLEFSIEVNTSRFFLICIMGWLFELPMFPPALFFNTFSSNHHPSLTSLRPISKDAIFLDGLNIVDRKLLYSCCPYLAEVKTLLTGTMNGVGTKSTPMKKITPVSANPPPKPLITEKPIQVQLEENFFDNHSPSLKKTVEFVSKRISSNCIKSINATLVPYHLAEATKALKTVAVVDGGGVSVEVDSLKSKMVEVERRESNATQGEAISFAHEFIEQHCTLALKILLPSDTIQQVMEVVNKITIRLATTRVMKWISTQIPGAMHTELSATLSKIMKSQSKDNQKQKLVIVPPTQHNPASYSPSEIIDRLKRLMRKLTCNLTMTFSEVQEEVNYVKKTLATRQDMTAVAYQSIHLLIAELIAALIVQHPDYLSRTVPHKMVEDANVHSSQTVDLTNYMTGPVEMPTFQNISGDEAPEIVKGVCEPLRAADNQIKEPLHEESAKSASMQDNYKSVYIEDNFYSNTTENSCNELTNLSAITVELNKKCNSRSGGMKIYDVRNVDQRSSSNEHKNLNAAASIQTLGRTKNGHLPDSDINQRKTTLLASMMSLWEGECPLKFPVEVVMCNKMDVLIDRSENNDKCLLVRQAILDEFVTKQK